MVGGILFTNKKLAEMAAAQYRGTGSPEAKVIISKQKSRFQKKGQKTYEVIFKKIKKAKKGGHLLDKLGY